MIEFSIGLLVGLVVAVLVIVATAHFRPSIDRSINRTISITKQKGEIIEPDSEELEGWIDSLSKE